MTGTGKAGPIAAPEELEAIENETIQPESQVEGDNVSPDIPGGDFLGPEACSHLCGMVFDVLATRRGDHWRLAAPEAEQLGGALDAVLGKYLPGNMDKWGPEITLATVVSMIVLPRMRVVDGET